MLIRADMLWPEIEKENLKCTCRHTGEPYWAIPRLRGNNPNLMFWIDESNKDMRFTEEPLTPMVVDGKISILEGNTGIGTVWLGLSQKLINPRTY